MYKVGELRTENSERRTAISEQRMENGNMDTASRDTVIREAARGDTVMREATIRDMAIWDVVNQGWEYGIRRDQMLIQALVSFNQFQITCS
jgi:hypothetical protein